MRAWAGHVHVWMDACHLIGRSLEVRAVQESDEAMVKHIRHNARALELRNAKECAARLHLCCAKRLEPCLVFHSQHRLASLQHTRSKGVSDAALRVARTAQRTEAVQHTEDIAATLGAEAL